MALPSTNDVVPHLRVLLAEYSEGVEPAALYDDLARRMGVRAEDLLKTVSGGRPRWPNRVQNARKQLVQAGEMHREPYGRWRLTAKGYRIALAGATANARRDDDEAIELFRSHNLRPTEQEQLILARIGQGEFRNGLLARDPTCALCGMDTTDLLIASHIKPWRDADNDERLDPDNGLLLCPNTDRLFDLGYISFSDHGNVLRSPYLGERARRMLCGGSSARLRVPIAAEYLAHHREHVLRR